MRRNLTGIILGVVLIGVAVTSVVWPDDPPTAAETRETLLSSPQEIQINISIDIPKGSESDNEPHQEIDAHGVVDLSSSHGEFTYDFNDLVNAAGYLGHLDELRVLYSDDSAYLEVFAEQPAWLRAQPEAVNENQSGRLRDILLTNPLIIPSYLDVESSARETLDGFILVIRPGSLADVTDPVGAEVGTFLDERGVDEIEVELSAGEDGPRVIVVSFTYDGLEGIDVPIEVVATYEFTPAPAPEFGIPAGDELREFSDLFS